ncbi:ENTH-domain-containing protein [Atractiella rhizophila]|nr:ENTH-domain-containing protein [Atractiella rhizophila]
MDLISSAASGVANISLGVAGGVASVAGVFKFSEYAAKVKEATNDQAWGAPSQLMLEIAEGTHDTKSFDQIMPIIWGKLADKNQKHWRQIYKALQLLEYLVKNGSERCVDDARMHMVSISALRNFYYVEDKTGKDQGLNGTLLFF